MVVRGTLPRLWPVPSQEEIASIVRMTDPVLRNLHITQTYHVLTIAMTDLLGEENVSWCAYATWASKTAGFFIRKEVVPGLIRDLLERADAMTRSMAGGLPEDFLGTWAAPFGLQALLTRALQQIADEIARQLSRGNLLVFEELAPLYAAMLEHFSGGERYDQGTLDRFLSRLSRGPVSREGQDLLIRAFTHYYEAMFEQDPKARAERIFLANALVGYHEQTRLQGPLIGALHAPLRQVFLDEVVEFLGVSSTRRANPLQEMSLRGTFGPLAARLERLWRELSTRALMRMELPDGVLRLGEDIPALNAERDFPPSLARVEHPELVSLMGTLDRTPNDTAGSAARDWGELGDRMNLIVDLFRTRQQDRVLYDQPFTFMQVDALRQGRVPHGHL
ncbi:hypothetical protein [Hyalangium rubrum]|uniref:Uncharacterized protein n=1 Tax=Hyalangium rubrum TaxID=3103134 RepID=A0ABU5HBJ9_9BACT|nr:hypothetical protein [Hyalangium sp. s54d21]MDY7230841.1 hypothetical protein [Hyalangium sp. s54d21]